jgi:hypothetical protein
MKVIAEYSLIYAVERKITGANAHELNNLIHCYLQAVYAHNKNGYPISKIRDIEDKMRKCVN